MNAKQYEEARRRLLMSHSAIGKFLGRSKRTSIRYTTGEIKIPDAVSMMLALMLEYHLDPPGMRIIEERWWGKSTNTRKSKGNRTS